MSDFKFKITMDVGIPKFSDATIPMRQIAERIVDDSQRNIRMQRSPPGMGGRFRPLAKETIKKKKKQGYIPYKKALLATQTMYRNIKWRKEGKNKYVVTVLGKGSPRRDLVAMIHQEIGVPSKQGRVARPFMGMSKQTRKYAVDRMQRWIKSSLKKRKPKYIKIGLT